MHTHTTKSRTLVLLLLAVLIPHALDGSSKQSGYGCIKKKQKSHKNKIKISSLTKTILQYNGAERHTKAQQLTHFIETSNHVTRATLQQTYQELMAISFSAPPNIDRNRYTLIRLIYNGSLLHKAHNILLGSCNNHRCTMSQHISSLMDIKMTWYTSNKLTIKNKLKIIDEAWSPFCCVALDKHLILGIPITEILPKLMAMVKVTLPATLQTKINIAPAYNVFIGHININLKQPYNIAALTDIFCEYNTITPNIYQSLKTLIKNHSFTNAEDKKLILENLELMIQNFVDII